MTGGLLPLRGYQKEAIAALERAWFNEGLRRPAIVLPTGAGKTVIFAHVARQAHERDGTRSLILVHTNELIEQAVSKLHDVAPRMVVGVVKAERDEHLEADVIVATVQTLRSERRRNAIANIGLVIIDECHHATAVSYRDVLSGFGCMFEGTQSDDPIPGFTARAVGFTATLARGDGMALGDVWQKVVYRRDILDMIEMGYLLPVRGKRIKVPDLDFSKVGRSRGDYQADELGEALTDSLAPELVAKAYMEHAGERSGILFAPTVASAYVFSDALNALGIISETVHGALPREERALILKRLNSGDTQVVCNCMVLTEGFDEPRVSCGVICRPTTSAPLYTQMVGRILRPYPGQANALLLDVVGVTGRHRLASLVDLVGDPTKVMREPDIESLADMLITADGFDLDEDKPIGGTAPGPEFVHADEVVAVDVDLFRRSHSAWLQTEGGTWILPAGKAYVFLAPSGGAGRWNVAVVGNVENKAVREFRYRRVSLDAAMSWGEETVRELGGNPLVNKRSAWRRASVPPTDKQMAIAAQLKIAIPEGMSKGELSNAISAKLASKMIDPIIEKWSKT